VDPLVATLFLILLALLGARFSFSPRRVPAGYRLLLKTGTHFLFLGFLLGPAALELLSAEALDQLSPLLGLALGWIGLLFGLQLDRSTLKQFPRVFVVLALGQALLTFLVFMGVGFLVADLAGVGGAGTTMVILGAAATASVTTPAGIAMVSANFMARGKVRELLFFIASLDAVVGITALHIAYASLHGTPAMVARGDQPVWFWLAAGPALAAVCALVFLWLARLRPSREELVLYLLGISALSAGAALQLQLSPLFVGLLAGALISNLNPQWHRIFRLMESWEKPIYLVLLILAGAALRFSTWWVIPLAAGYVLVRGAAKVVTTAVLVNVLSLPFPTPRRLGLGLVAQGGISIAMALSLVLTMSGTDPTLGGFDAAELLFAAVVLGVVVSELVGPLLTTAVLRAAGEIRPGVEEALARGDEVGARAEAHASTREGRAPGGGERA
jgi:hypothetical protein